MKKSVFNIIAGILAVACAVCLFVAIAPVADGSLDNLNELHRNQVSEEVELRNELEEYEEQLDDTPYSDTNNRDRLERLIEIKEEQIDDAFDKSYRYLENYRNVSDRCRNMGIVSAICGVGAVVVFVIGKKKEN